MVIIVYNLTTKTLLTENDAGFHTKFPKIFSVNSIYKDNNNNMWFLTDEGI